MVIQAAADFILLHLLECDAAPLGQIALRYAYHAAP